MKCARTCIEFKKTSEKGLMKLESNQVQGNFGIMDQKLAIKWVYENIDTFGGDMNKV